MFQIVKWVGGLIFKGAHDIGVEKQRAKAIILSSWAGMLFTVIVFIFWQMTYLYISLGFSPPGGLEILLKWQDDIRYLLFTVLLGSGAGIAAGKRLEAKDVEVVREKAKERKKYQDLLEVGYELSDLVVYRDYMPKYTSGVIYYKGQATGIHLLELKQKAKIEGSYMKNVKRKTCILEGTYDIEFLERTASGKDYKGTGAWWVKDVPGRSGILLHLGNTVHDILGCGAPCLSIKLGWGKSSKQAMIELTKLIKENNIQEITFSKL